MSFRVYRVMPNTSGYKQYWWFSRVIWLFHSLFYISSFRFSCFFLVFYLNPLAIQIIPYQTQACVDRHQAQLQSEITQRQPSPTWTLSSGIFSVKSNVIATRSGPHFTWRTCLQIHINTRMIQLSYYIYLIFLFSFRKAPTEKKCIYSATSTLISFHAHPYHYVQQTWLHWYLVETGLPFLLALSPELILEPELELKPAFGNYPPATS